MTLTRLLVPSSATACAALAALAAAVALAGCGAAPESAGKAAAPAASAKAAGVVTLTPEAVKAAGVEVAPARVITRSDSLTAPGLVQLNERRTARIGAVVEGVVVDVSVQPGDRVTKGQGMATVLSHLFHDAWASYFKALAGRRSAERDVAYATSARDRAARLVQDKALSPLEAERAAADQVHAEQELNASRAEVTRTEQDLAHYGITPREDAIPEQEDRIAIVAPFDAVVIERLVSPGVTVTPGTPLIVTSDLSTVWVIAEVDEAHLAQLASGREASVTTPAYPGESFGGTIDAVGDVINSETRRVAVRLVVPNPGRRLKPQMFVTARLGVQVARPMVVVPASAVQQWDGSPVVFVRADDGAYHRRAITHGTEVDGLVEVRSGLKEGEQVVVAGAFLLKSKLAEEGQLE